MAVARMKRVSVICHSSLRDGAIMRLQEAGAMELLDASPSCSNSAGNCMKEGQAFERDAGSTGRHLEGLQKYGPGEGTDMSPEAQRALDKALDELAFCIKYLGKYVKEKKGLVETFVTLKADISPEDYAYAVTQFDYKGIFKQCSKDEASLNELVNETSRLKEKRALLEGWVDLDCPVQDLSDTEKVRVFPFSLPKKNLESLTAQLKGDRPAREAEDDGDFEPPIAHVEIVSEDSRNVRMIVMCLKGHGELKIIEILGECGAERVAFGNVAGQVKEEIRRIDDRLLRIPEEEQEIQKRAQSYLSERIKLMALYDHLYERRRRMEAQEYLGNTDETSIVQGWAREKDVARVKRGLADLASEIEVLVEDPLPEDTVPVVLENPWFLKPFEVVTLLYGNPKYDEIDPTPFLAPFFFIFFGLALSDAGYGILLMLISAWMVEKTDIPEGGKNLFKLLFIGGISTVIFGALMGGWFGNTLDILPPALGGFSAFLKRFAILDPLGNPISVLGISLALGVLQIWVGIALKLASRVKQGETVDAVMDEGSWLFFIPAVVIMAFSSSRSLGPITPAVGKWLAIIGALYVMVAAGRHQKIILLKPFSAILGLYGSISYVGDVLSYARLLALGLATGVIAIVLNQIAALALEIPIVGVIGAVVIMVGGHIFNLLVNTLGSFVHAGRLQFVEFFTKFFEGGGRTFRPFRREPHYTTVKAKS